MVRRRKTTKGNGKTKRSTRPRGKRPPRRTSNMNQPQVSRNKSLGQVIGTGIRSLVSMLPGQAVLAPVTDFLLKSVGLAKSIAFNGTGSSAILTADVANFAVVGKFIITTGSLLRDMPFTEINSRADVLTRYDQFRVKTLSVSLQPTGDFANRPGEWLVSLVPFINPDDHKWFDKADVPPVEQLMSFGMFERAPASRSLMLSFTPSLHHGQSFLFHDCDHKFCGVYVHYERYHRVKYDEFSATDVSFNTYIRSTLEARLPVAYGGWPQYTIARTRISDSLTTINHVVENDGLRYFMEEDYKCTSKNGLCTVSGKFRRGDKPPGLDGFVNLKL